MSNEAAKTNPNLIMALVAESDFQFGLSRIFEAYTCDVGPKTKVIRTRFEAENWIKDELRKKEPISNEPDLTEADLL